jgi:hypothetical protein
MGAGFLYFGMKYFQKPSDNEIPSVRIGGTEIPVEVAKTDEERAKGLSGRISLEANKGMLFVFSEPGNYSFWMPDMNFPIDIIWITNGKVVGIENNVSNEFDPQNPRFYLPPQPVKYVLEVNAGFAEARGIKIGDIVIFSNITE